MITFEGPNHIGAAQVKSSQVTTLQSFTMLSRTRTYITVLSLSGSSSDRSLAQIFPRGNLSRCQKLYARMCCGRVGNLTADFGASCVATDVEGVVDAWAVTADVYSWGRSVRPQSAAILVNL